MTKSFPLLICLLCMLFLFACDTKNEKLSKDPPTDWFFKQRAFPYGDINTKTYLQALETKKQSLLNRNVSTAFDQEWNFIGPSNIGGRITDLEMWPDDLNTILAGSASGGIFKSMDQGITWDPIFDDAASLAIGDMAISTSNPEMIYVGTGEANSGGGSLAYDGIGVYKSRDRGDTWEHIGLEGVGSIGRVAIDPMDENKVFVAAMGRLFGGNPERGIFRTEDGGDSWEHVLSLSDTTGGIDLAIHPTNSDIVFAAMWERSRRPNDIIYGGETSGIYRSKDGGDTWELLENGLPTLPDSKGRMAIAIAPTNPDKVYVFVADKIGFTEGIYVSDDGGDSWTNIPSEGIQDVSFQWWFGKLFVSPVDENDIYIASFNMHKYTVGDPSWTSFFPGVHVDQHALFVHPLDPDFMVNGNDGGIYVSYDGGDNYIKSTNLPNMQFYACEIDPNDTGTVLGGTQDNGSYRNQSDDPNSWSFILGGDGFRSMVEPSNSDVFYVEFQNGNTFRTLNGGLNLESIISTIDQNDRKNWNTPIALDFNSPNRIYYGSQRVWRSVDRGTTFFPISEDLTNGPYDGNRTFGTIVTLESSRLNSDILYAGTDDGNVWNSIDNGTSWNKLDVGMNTPRWTTAVLPDPQDEQTAYVSFSGFRYDSNDGSVYKTTDHGETWIDITGDLPDIPINDIQVDLRDNRILFVATDIGVYFSKNEGSSWEVLGQGLPNVPVIDIDIEQDGKLAAATYGRSMYYYIVPDVTSVNDIEFVKANVYPNPTSDYINIDMVTSQENLKAEFYSLDGRLVLSQNKLSANINLQHLPKGAYILSLKNKKGQIVLTKKIFKN